MTAGNAVRPRYDGRSILNIPASVCTALGGPTAGLASPLDPTVLPPAMLEGVGAVLLLVVDGLGRGIERAHEAVGVPLAARGAEVSPLRNLGIEFAKHRV